MNECKIGSADIAYRIYGSGNKILVIDSCLGSCSAEWWHIGEALSDKYKILLYDRAGYGNSTVSTLSRTPKNIASELNTLLKSLNMDKNIVILGHSQGGLNAIQYATLYPNQVRGLILIDPATPFDNEFKEKLSTAEYKKSGVDKTMTLKIGIMTTSLGLGFAFKPLLKKSPPFCYYEFSDEAKDYMLGALCKKSTYKTALAEYEFAHNKNDTQNILEAIKNSVLQDLPIILLTHSSDFYIKELKHFANLDLQTAQKIEFLWQEIMKRCLSLSSHTKHIIAPNSGHYIQLTDYKILRKSIDCLFPD
ncbi:MAG: alpha/beta hydrolase [Clostridiaceae bacterium]|nr:alpha/beta hydrolase [Clostridiaceae bacterium]